MDPASVAAANAPLIWLLLESTRYLNRAHVQLEDQVPDQLTQHYSQVLEISNRRMKLIRFGSFVFTCGIVGVARWDLLESGRYAFWILFALLFGLRMHRIPTPEQPELLVTSYTAWTRELACFWRISVVGLLATLFTSIMRESVWWKIELGLSLGVFIMLQMARNEFRFQNRLLVNDTRTKEPQSSWWSYLIFSFMDDILGVGFVQALEQEDLDDLIDQDKADYICETFESGRNKSRGLIWNLFAYNAWTLIFQAVVTISSTFLALFRPFVLNKILNFVQDPEKTPGWMAMGYTVAIFLATVIRSLCDGQRYFLGRRIGIRVRAILIDLVYRKSLQRICKSQENADAGRVINLMSVDASKILEATSYFMDSYATLIEVIIGPLYLIYVAGWAGLAGFGVMLVMMPIGALIGRLTERLQRKLMKSTDARINAINEVLQGIRILKFFSWEERFEAKISQLRENELQNLWTYVIVNGLSRMMWISTPVIVSFVTFSTLSYLTGDLDASTAFTALAIFNWIRNPLAGLPVIIVRLAEAYVGFSRIQQYLDETEYTNYLEPSDQVQFLKESSFAWELNQQPKRQFSLKSLDLVFPEGGLTVIYGPTGAGKSTLLHALLGELHCISGGVKIKGPIAYSSQLVWLQNATIRDNILFGEPFDEQRYASVLTDCALLRDLETLDGGDLTEIGEKGVNLSGGQKARIALARAVYSKAQIVLLDDPLSAVDAPTAKHLFERAICGKLMKNRTRILVSHAISLCETQADYVVQLNRGIIVSSEHKLVHPLVTETIDQPVKLSQKEKNLVLAESRFKGSVSLQVYWTYIMAAGGFMFLFFVMLSYGFAQLSVVSNDWWLKTWADQFNDKETNYVLIYLALSTCTILAYFSRILVIASGSLHGSRNLHSQLIHKILRSPIRFFEKTPMGRIMNRASKDIKDVDQEVAFFGGDFFGNLMRTLAFMTVIVFITPSALIGIVPVALTFSFIGLRYVRTSRELKRLDSNTRSPIFSHFGETISGQTTIRAYGRSEAFVTDLHRKIDLNHQAFSFMWIANRWLGTRVDFVGALITLSTTMAVVYNVMYGLGMNAGAAGLSMTYALSFTEALLWMIRMHALLEMELNAVERIGEYLKLEEEAPPVIESNRPPHNWPDKGKIEVKDLSMRYSEDSDLVLNKVSFSLEPRQKLAIVGRTGAGKSTLSLAFFRFIEHCGGSITIDDINISKIGLHDLRSQLTIIPQDPVLFSGDLRSNLDPIAIYSDQDIWEALRLSGFLNSIQSARSRDASNTSGLSKSTVPEHITLDTFVEEGGRNFSQGQRQLLCLARALLRKCNVIILDEATASVDHDTDAMIQETIKKGFGFATLLCIAHRLRTIIDYDRVLVLDKGIVSQFGSPRELIGKQGIFRTMCQESGEFEYLEKMAK
ncbi:P-loop containing nucleoside triphosphate hydrolase protein, partial [Gorgonomyces haynaldii]